MKKVEVYTQPDCPPCSIVKQMLQHYSVAFTEYNIQEDFKARDRLVYDYNAYSTPTVVVDGVAVVGFDPEKLQELLGIQE
ncbi:glutaredoxin domain-containing protein [Ectobacillus ponti]|uniref:NrdH-redoxin n=1 Tax=Ectobacillus ponti TaxID=2961894 RepID=A0AA41X8W9_9BACI|nr:glutaredoxin domain-containing protein [Ectobacillus ponti]MCP8970882.1 NrdH-redoxin [Ectobacillus ponti]